MSAVGYLMYCFVMIVLARSCVSRGMTAFGWVEGWFTLVERFKPRGAALEMGSLIEP